MSENKHPGSSNDMDLLKERLRSCSWASNTKFSPNSSTKSYIVEQWEKLLENISLPENEKEKAMEWLSTLWSLHSQPERHYHTAVHLQEMISYYEILKDSPCLAHSDFESNIILLAIFFHDSIYDVHSTTNEEDSAKLFEKFANELALDQTLQKQVVDYILATKKHQVSQDNTIGMSIFLDLDMAVLGKASNAYQVYANLIRREYDYVPIDTYCDKRAEILTIFLQQERIYGTAILRETWETRARENIQTEIEMLRQGMIPNGVKE